MKWGKNWIKAFLDFQFVYLSSIGTTIRSYNIDGVLV